jgi:hypothetical protein
MTMAIMKMKMEQHGIISIMKNLKTLIYYLLMGIIRKKSNLFIQVIMVHRIMISISLVMRMEVQKGSIINNNRINLAEAIPIHIYLI